MQSKTKQLTLYIRLGPQILTFDVELPGSQDWAPKLNPFLSRDTIETVSLPEASLVYPLQIILHATWVQLKPQCKQVKVSVMVDRQASDQPDWLAEV
jgi:hypothetical protein